MSDEPNEGQNYDDCPDRFENVSGNNYPKKPQHPNYHVDDDHDYRQIKQCGQDSYEHGKGSLLSTTAIPVPLFSKTMSATTPISAEIDLQETIPVIIQVVSKATGKPIPGATVSNVVWNEDNTIGAFIPTSDPNTFFFTPSKAGTMNFSATATVNLPN